MLQMFERSLAERYARLYGKKNFQKKVEKERRKLLFTGAAILAFLCAALLFGLAEGEESYEYMRFNQKGELIEIKRPSAEQGAISFSARVQMGAGASARTKEDVYKRQNQDDPAEYDSRVLSEPLFSCDDY